MIFETMLKRLLFFVLVIAVSGEAWAQVEGVVNVGDTLRMGDVPTMKPSETVGDAVSPYGLEQTDFGSFENKEQMPLDSIKPMMMTYKFERQKPMTALGRWNGGWVTGGNNIYFTPLVGYTATANVLAVENVGRWEFMGMAGLQKYGGMANTFTFDASAMYKINDNMSATMFGNYQSPSFWSTYKTPSGYQYGGYLSFETNNHKWGIDVGARHVFNPWNGQHAVIPIVKPYYKIGNSKLGIDLGGLFNRNGANDGPPMFVPKSRPMPPAPRR